MNLQAQPLAAPISPDQNDHPHFSIDFSPMSNKEVQQRNRRALDEIVFDALGLSRGEQEAVYEAVVDLVNKRLEKAGSV